MIRTLIGEQVFQAGLSAYLKQHSYANADRDDLLQSLTSALIQQSSMKQQASLNLTTFADSWTRQLGFPVVRMTRQPVVVNDNSSSMIEFSFDQRLFKLDANANENARFQPNPFDFRWQIPIRYRTIITGNDNDEVKFVWLNHERTNGK
jgi:aminopeptidase N